MNKTNQVIAAVTRHALTGGGVAGIVSAHDDLLQFVSVVITGVGLVWSILEKIRRPATPPSAPANNSGT